jgi:hypothetical protein
VNPVLKKLSSVTAVSLLLMVVVLCSLTIWQGVEWKETFASTLSALLGYYIGRNRKNEEEAPK